MVKREIPPATSRRFEAMAEALVGRGVSASKMFGMPCLKTGRKAFAGVFGDSMVFKLGGDALARALALKGAALFDPAAMGRPMKEWVVVPSAHAKHWSDPAEQAREYVSG